MSQPLNCISKAVLSWLWFCLSQDVNLSPVIVRLTGFSLTFFAIFKGIISVYISLDLFQVSRLWIYHQRRRKKQLLAHLQLIQPWIYSRLSTHLWPQAQSLQKGPLKNHLILPLAILKAERSIPRRS